MDGRDKPAMTKRYVESNENLSHIKHAGRDHQQRGDRHDMRQHVGERAGAGAFRGIVHDVLTNWFGPTGVRPSGSGMTRRSTNARAN